jgi:FkbH-like protein
MTRQTLSTALNRLRIEPSYNTYMAMANALETTGLDSSGLHPMRVAVLRNFTFDALLPVVQGEIALAGFFPLIYQGDFDSIARDVLDPNSALYAFQPEFVIVAQWLETLAPALVTRFISLSTEQIAAEVERVLASIEEIVATLRQRSKAPILLNNFPLPAHTTLGILDSQLNGYQIHTILKLNQELLQRIRQWRDVFLVDYFNLMAQVGSTQGIDERYWQIGRAPIGRHALLPFGQEYGKFIRALRGKTRKCLVLDCDNTLWGGVVGEDGIGGIKLGSTYPGSCYQAFQREILNLHDRGVILALCSKNNEADVLEVLHNHPETILREEHLATRQINWDDKVTNLNRIAQSLNIGLDSLVFVDDSQFECDLVREQLPQIAVVQLPADPSAFTAKISARAYFDSLTFSAEDRERNHMYRDESQRKQLFETAGSLETYLANLEMVAEIGQPDEITTPRVSQLTQKTNQFNLTTRRYSEGDISSFVKGDDTDVFFLRLRDRISDLGLIGVAIVKYNGKQAEIDTFLLSCRAIGRGAEEALLSHVFTIAKLRGCIRIVGEFIPTPKNSLAADFYRRQGFKLVAESIQASDWELSLDNSNISAPKWITVKPIL